LKKYRILKYFSIQKVFKTAAQSQKTRNRKLQKEYMFDFFTKTLDFFAFVIYNGFSQTTKGWD